LGFLTLFQRFGVFFVVKCPAADAADAPQPWGLLCNPVMKMVSFLSFFRVIEHRWNEIDRVKPKYSGKNLSQCHFVHHKSHIDWPRDRTHASAVRGRRLTAWAMTWPTFRSYVLPPSSVLPKLAQVDKNHLGHHEDGGSATEQTRQC
jgi:hypothetical protein